MSGTIFLLFSFLLKALSLQLLNYHQFVTQFRKNEKNTTQIKWISRLSLLYFNKYCVYNVLLPAARKCKNYGPKSFVKIGFSLSLIFKQFVFS